MYPYVRLFGHCWPGVKCSHGASVLYSCWQGVLTSRRCHFSCTTDSAGLGALHRIQEFPKPELLSSLSRSRETSHILAFGCCILTPSPRRSDSPPKCRWNFWNSGNPDSVFHSFIRPCDRQFTLLQRAGYSPETSTRLAGLNAAAITHQETPRTPPCPGPHPTPNEMELVKPACIPRISEGALGESGAQERRHEVRDARVGAVVGARVGGGVGAVSGVGRL